MDNKRLEVYIPAQVELDSLGAKVQELHMMLSLALEADSLSERCRTLNLHVARIVDSIDALHTFLDRAAETTGEGKNDEEV